MLGFDKRTTFLAQFKNETLQLSGAISIRFKFLISYPWNAICNNYYATLVERIICVGDQLVYGAGCPNRSFAQIRYSVLSRICLAFVSNYFKCRVYLNFCLIERTREIIYRVCVNFVFYWGVFFLFNLLMFYFFRFVTWSKDVLAPPSSRW